MAIAKPLDTPLPAEWQKQGKCNLYDSDLLFPRSEQALRNVSYICHDCPVKRPCLIWALDTIEEYGVWGAMTPTQRRAIVKRIPDGLNIAELVDEHGNIREELLNPEVESTGRPRGWGRGLSNQDIQ